MAEHPTPLDQLLTDCLEAIESQRWTVEDCLERYPVQRAELEPLLRTASRLRQAGLMVRLPETFSAAAAARLQARLHTSHRLPTQPQSPTLSTSAPAAPSVSGMPWPAVGLGVVAVASAVLLMAAALLAGVLAFFADRAAPGDPLYGLDRSLEQARLNMAAGPEATVGLQLDFAGERLDEATRLAAAGDAALAEQALEDYVATISGITAGDLPAGASVEETLAQYQDALAALRETAPASTLPLVDEALAASTLPETAPVVAPTASATSAPTSTAGPAPALATPPPGALPTWTQPDATFAPETPPGAATSPAQACQAAAPHPEAITLGGRYGVPPAEIMGWFCQGFGFGVIDIAYGLSRELGAPVADVFAMRSAGMSWGEIRQAVLRDQGDDQPGPPDRSGEEPGKPDKPPGDD